MTGSPLSSEGASKTLTIMTRELELLRQAYLASMIVRRDMRVEKAREHEASRSLAGSILAR
jgi:hypothetical protein